MTSQITYNDNDRAIVKAFTEKGDMTIAEFNAYTNLNLKPGHFTSAVKKGLIAATDTKRIIEVPSQRQVVVYRFVTTNVTKNAEGTDYNYTDNEIAVLDLLKSNFEPNATFTLKDLNDLSDTPLTSGRINSLVKKGNIVNTGEKTTIPAVAKRSVNVYHLVGSINE